MNFIRRFTYAGVLALITLTVGLSPASAQERARGGFTLPHDVRWGEAKVPAGEYRFTFEMDTIGGVLKLRKVDGSRTGFLFVVREMEEAKPSDKNRLVLDDTAQGSYVSAMELPEFDVRLHFPAPAAEKQMAKAGTSVVGQ